MAIVCSIPTCPDLAYALVSAFALVKSWGARARQTGSNTFTWGPNTATRESSSGEEAAVPGPPGKPNRGVAPWTKLMHLRWHQTARIVAALVLLDQAVGPITAMPPSEAIVVVALGALFAPVPAEKDK